VQELWWIECNKRAPKMGHLRKEQAEQATFVHEQNHPGHEITIEAEP